MAPSTTDGPTDDARGARTWRRGVLVLGGAGLLAAGCSAGSPGPARTGPMGHATDGAAVGGPAPPGADGLRAVSCPTSQVCWAAGSRSASAADPGGGVVIGTRDGGDRWSVQAGFVSPGFLYSLSCPDTRRCMAVGQVGTSPTGTVLVTTDGGRRWRTLAPPSGATALFGVQCANARQCLVVAQDASGYWSATTSDFGQSFLRGGELPSTFTVVSDLSCAAGTCAAVGTAPPSGGHATGVLAGSADDGTTWTAAVLPATVGLLHATSCSAAGCAALGTASTTVSDVVQAPSQLLTDTGGSWQLSTAGPAIGDGFGLACSSADNCVVVGADWVPRSPPTPIGGATHTLDGGGTWTTPALTGLPSTLVGVDCPRSTSCVAVGGDVIARLTLPAGTRRRVS